MSKLNKILLILFYLFFFLILVEVGAYFIFLQINPLTEEQKKIIESVKKGGAAAYLNNFKNTSKRKVSLIIEQTGFVGDITHDGTNGNIYLKILDEENKKIVTFILNQINLPKTTFYRVEKSGQISIGVNDVKKGDKIMIRITEGITEDTNKSEFFIYEK